MKLLPYKPLQLGLLQFSCCRLGSSATWTCVYVGIWGDYVCMHHQTIQSNS